MTVKWLAGEVMLKKLFKHKGIFCYLSFDLINKAIPFIALPIIAEILSIEDFSKFSFSLVLVTVMSMAFMSGIQSRIIIDESNHSQVGKLAYLTSFAAVVALYSIVSIPALATLELPSGVFLWAALYALVLMMASFYQARAQYIPYGLVTVGYSVFLYSLVFLFTVLKGERISYIELVLFVALFLPVYALGVLILGLRHDGGKVVSRVSIMAIFVYCASQIPHVFSNIIRFAFDRFAIASVDNFASFMAIYNVAMQVAMILSVLLVSCNRYWFRYYMNNWDRLRGNYKFFVFSVLAVVSLAILVYVFSIFYIRSFFSEEFHAATEITPYLILGFCFQGLYFLCVPEIYRQEKLSIINIGSLISVSVYVICCLGFMHLYGHQGIPIAFLFGWFSLFLLTVSMKTIYCAEKKHQI